MRKLLIILACLAVTSCKVGTYVPEPIGQNSRFYCPVKLPKPWMDTMGKEGTFALINKPGHLMVFTKHAYPSPWEMRKKDACKSGRHNGCFQGNGDGTFSIHYPKLWKTTEYHELCHVYLFPLDVDKNFNHRGWLTYEPEWAKEL